MAARSSALYRVSGRRGYRGHLPGEIFEASIETAAETRALARGDIEVVERIIPSVQPGSYRLPRGWASHEQEN